MKQRACVSALGRGWGRVGFALSVFASVASAQEPPVDEETRFMIDSVTKSMTTALAAVLVSEGRLDWDDPVADYLPSFALSNPDWTPLVRMRDALGHPSGVQRSDLSLLST